MDCEHFTNALQYQKNRTSRGPSPKTFTMRVDPEVEDAVDQALHWLESGRKPEATRRIRQLYAANPDLSCTQYAIGVLHIVEGDSEQAATYFEKAVKTFPFFAEAHFNLYSCYIEMLQINQALRSLQNAHDAAQVGGPLHKRTGDLLQEFKNSIRLSDGVDLDTFLKAGDVFDHGFKAMERGNFRQAIIDFQECIRLKPKGYQAYGNLGICYGRLGMFDKAYAMLDKALQINPDYEPAKWNRLALEAHAAGADVGETSINYTAARYFQEIEKVGPPPKNGLSRKQAL